MKDKAPAGSIISPLELFTGKGLVDVTLAREYYSPTQDEKTNLKYIQEGCFTVLEKENDCALVGPIRPCQLITLSNNQKIIVAHLVYNASLSSLLAQTKQEFGSCDLSQTTGTILTVTDPDYDKKSTYFDVFHLSQKDKYEGRTQLEEVKKTKDTILKTFNIKNRTQIDAHKFTSKKQDLELGNYEFAEVYTFVKYSTAEKALIYNTCPMAEDIFGNFQSLPIRNRLESMLTKRDELAHKNPYFINNDNSPYTLSYGRFPFVKI